MSNIADCALDELDIAILKRLTADGRRRYTDIAEGLGVSHGTVRNRVQRMQEANSLKIASWLDPVRVGFHAGAHIKLSTEQPGLEETISRIAAFPEVTWLGQTMGEFNLMGDVFCENIQRLKRFVSQDLHAIPQVRHMEVGVYSRIYKVTTLPSLDLLECPPERGVGSDGHGGTSSSATLGRAPIHNQIPRTDASMYASGGSDLDQLDIAILEHLSADGRRPFTEIAEALGVSHGTIRNRYHHMLDRNVVRVMAWLEPQDVGFQAYAHVDLSVTMADLAEAASRITAFPEVAWLTQVMGEFNLMADVFCVDLDCLDHLLADRLGRIPGLQRMEVALYTKVRKITTMPNLELLRRAVGNG